MQPGNGELRRVTLLNIEHDEHHVESDDMFREDTWFLRACCGSMFGPPFFYNDMKIDNDFATFSPFGLLTCQPNRPCNLYMEKAWDLVIFPVLHPLLMLQPRAPRMLTIPVDI